MPAAANAPGSALPPERNSESMREEQDHIFRIAKDGYTILRGVWVCS